MNKILLRLLSLLLILAPAIVLADDSSSNSITFTPPPGDISVIFLGNIFGIVDGVLHGTGSQIMGTMFGVFNAAVLALGGIIIMYTLMVSTVNTAHEGQMLGQKWSSIWVPLRSTLGLALLIPKTSGYCLMQIFVMWVILQGVGAADKVWEAALSYLNRGGVIIQTQINPITSFLGDNSKIATGAMTILSGQVCMLGLQTALETQRQGYQNRKSKDSGPCSGSPSKKMQMFCETAVPDFIGTVNATETQRNNKGSSTLVAKMPNFESGSPYAALNGVCGEIQWSSVDEGDMGKVKSEIPITQSELDTATMSRAIAVQQMYMDLSSIAQIMVSNDPQVNQANQNDNSQQQPFSSIAMQQFGVPYNGAGVVCTSATTKKPPKQASDSGSGSEATNSSTPPSTPSPDACTGWGADPSGDSAPLFGGTEFQGAIADYNGIMLPTLNLISQAKNSKIAASQRQFIQTAVTQGWILAGSYFFDLARLNTSDINSSSQTDTNSGLEGSSFDTSKPVSAFEKKKCVGQYAILCTWFGGDSTAVTNVIGLINGSSVLSPPLQTPSMQSTNRKVILGPGSSTVYGYVNNASMVSLPGQPGLTPPEFALKFNLNIQTGAMYLQEQSFPCGSFSLIFFNFCLGALLGDIVYNLIIRTVINFFFDLMVQVINNVILTFLSLPLLGMASIYTYGVAFIQQPTVNPIVALANMGANYINFANELWIFLLGLSILTSLIPWFGIFIFALMIMIAPVMLAWFNTMLAIGFTTAYYIPFVPYMIFTFGSIAWLTAVIEAMVAAPIVALGVTHPEGEGAFGKGEQAIMILMNVFLRPAMMIIGYIAAIALSFVSVWVINAGFANVVTFIQGDPNGPTWNFTANYSSANGVEKQAGDIHNTTGYTGWAGVYGFFFSILMYITMYMTVVQKAFNLIAILPDKVLRWIGGQAEQAGQESMGWTEESKKQSDALGTAAAKASAQMSSNLSGKAQELGQQAAGALAGGASATASGGGAPPAGGGGGGAATPDNTPPPGGGGGGSPGGDITQQSGKNRTGVDDPASRPGRPGSANKSMETKSTPASSLGAGEEGESKPSALSMDDGSAPDSGGGRDSGGSRDSGGTDRAESGS